MNIFTVLRDKGYAYNPMKGQWFDNRRKCQRDDVLVFIIRVLKSEGTPNAGEKAAEILSEAERAPEISFSFLKKEGRLQKEYGSRIRGRDVFLLWLESARPELFSEISGLPDREAGVLLRKQACLLHRFYAAAEMAGIQIRNVARIGIEGVFRHVFFGWRIKGAGRARRASLDKLTSFRLCDALTAASTPEPDPHKRALMMHEAFLKQLFRER